MNLQELQNFYSGKKVLLTGHTGFKGSWMLTLLHYLGADIKGYALEAPDASLYNSIQGHKLCQSVIADIRDKASLHKVVLDFEPEIIFHMAAQPLVLEAYEQPAYTYEVNAMGTVYVLEALQALKGRCSLINITTDKVYDNKEWIYPYRENDPLGGYDPYSASKACSELISASFRNSFFNPSQYAQHLKSVATVRAGNVIGGGDWADKRIIPDIVRAISRQEEVVLRNPAAVRPWQHVLEAVYGYLLLACRMDSNPEALAQAFNFGPLYDEAVSVEQLVQLSIDAWGQGSYSVQQSAQQPHEAKLLRLDCSKAVDELKWKPRWNATAAIQQTMHWYKSVVADQQPAIKVTIEQIDAYLTQD